MNGLIMNLNDLGLIFIFVMLKFNIEYIWERLNIQLQSYERRF
jgi:hypothetical protein